MPSNIRVKDFLNVSLENINGKIRRRDRRPPSKTAEAVYSVAIVSPLLGLLQQPIRHLRLFKKDMQGLYIVRDTGRTKTTAAPLTTRPPTAGGKATSQ